MTGYLPDVNVLIALLDPTHVHHARAHAWFTARDVDRWYTVPLTENGVIRIVSSPRYSNSQPIPAIVTSLRSLYALGDHRAVHDTISLLDAGIDLNRLNSSAQVTDTYLIAQAKTMGARLATLDRRITSLAVVDAEHSVYQLP